jgi:hypothetical protein
MYKETRRWIYRQDEDTCTFSKAGRGVGEACSRQQVNSKFPLDTRQPNSLERNFRGIRSKPVGKPNRFMNACGGGLQCLRHFSSHHAAGPGSCGCIGEQPELGAHRYQIDA